MIMSPINCRWGRNLKNLTVFEIVLEVEHVKSVCKNGSNNSDTTNRSVACELRAKYLKCFRVMNIFVGNNRGWFLSTALKPRYKVPNSKHPCPLAKERPECQNPQREIKADCILQFKRDCIQRFCAYWSTVNAAYYWNTPPRTAMLVGV